MLVNPATPASHALNVSHRRISQPPAHPTFIIPLFWGVRSLQNSRKTDFHPEDGSLVDFKQVDQVGASRLFRAVLQSHCFVLQVYWCVAYLLLCVTGGNQVVPVVVFQSCCFVWCGSFTVLLQVCGRHSPGLLAVCCR